MMKLYLAGSTAEIERAEVVLERLKQHSDKIKVVSTWTASVRAHSGISNPRDASWLHRRELSEGCLAEVECSDVLWFLVPAVDKPTRGAWGELCYAFALGRYAIASGDTKQSIFTALAVEYATDDEALATLLRDAEHFAARPGAL